MQCFAIFFGEERIIKTSKKITLKNDQLQNITTEDSKISLCKKKCVRERESNGKSIIFRFNLKKKSFKKYYD